jgi:hypothetical protein
MKRIITVFAFFFGIASANAQNVFHDLNTWHTYQAKNLFGLNVGPQLEIANGWTGYDSILISLGKSVFAAGNYQKSIFKVPGNGGSGFAMQVRTMIQDSIPNFTDAGPLEMVATSANVSIDLTAGDLVMSGGIPLTGTPVSISFWIKDSSVGNDELGLEAVLIDNGAGSDDTIAIADSFFTQQYSNWTLVTLPFKYTPSTGSSQLLRVSVSTLTDAASGESHEGTSITVDDVTINFPVGVTEKVFSASLAKIYPVPASTNLNIELKEKGNYSFEAYDATGKLIIAKKCNDLNTTIDVSNWMQQSYFYIIKNERNYPIQSGNFIVQ